MAFNLKRAAHLCSSAHGPERERGRERESERESSLSSLVVVVFLCVWQRIWAAACLSVSLSGWMSQLTERSSITQESDVAELSLTDGEMKGTGWRERWRGNRDRCFLSNPIQVVWDLHFFFRLPVVWGDFAKGGNELWAGMAC